MVRIKISIVLFLCTTLLFPGCTSLNKTQKGGANRTVSGGARSAIDGKIAGNAGLGAIIGAAVGGATGIVIGHKMDNQAAEIKNTVHVAKVERVGEGIVVEFDSKVLFGFDRSNLSVDAKTNLDKLVKILNVYADTDIEVQGHTDNKGKESTNQDLSQSWAGEVSGYLFNNGIANNRIRTKGFGKNMPGYDNNTEEGRSQNRRVEFLITANEKMKAEAGK